MCEFKPPKPMRGYFEIGIYQGKTEANLGTLWRSAYQLGASGIFVIGARYKRQASDVVKAYKHIPFREYETFEQFQENRPNNCQLVGVEMDGAKLTNFSHPSSAIYLLGAEDYGLPGKVRDKCNTIVSLESMRMNSFNVAVAGSLVMYDRVYK